MRSNSVMTNEIYITAVKNRALMANKWSVIATLLPRVISPFATILLSWFLLPRDYGIVAVSLTFVTLSQVIQETGIGQTLIQCREKTEEARVAAFWISVIVGMALSGVVYLSALQVATFFAFPEVTRVLQIQSWQILISSLGTVPLSILRREYQFRKIAVIMILPSLTPLFVTLPLAIFNYGYWALVAGSMLGAALQTTSLWTFCTWRPTVTLDITTAKNICRFGAYVTLEGLTGWFVSRIDRVFLGHFVTSSILGLYAYGSNLVALAVMTISLPFNSNALYATYCEIADDRREVLRLLKSNLEMFALVLFPVCIGIASIGDIGIALVFPEEWSGLTLIVTLLIISPGLFNITQPFSLVLKAIGRPDLLAKLYSIYVLICAPVLWYAATCGLEVFVWSKFLLQMVFFLPSMIVISYAFNVSVLELLKPLMIPALSAVLMSVVVRLLILSRILGEEHMLQLVGASCLGAMFYIIVIYFLDRQLLLRFKNLILRSFGWF